MIPNKYQVQAINEFLTSNDKKQIAAECGISYQYVCMVMRQATYKDKLEYAYRVDVVRKAIDMAITNMKKFSNQITEKNNV